MGKRRMTYEKRRDISGKGRIFGVMGAPCCGEEK